MWDPKTVIEVGGTLNQMADAEFFISFHMCKFLLGFIKPLSTALQGSDMDVVNGCASVTTLMNDLTEMWSNKENEFARVFRDANAMAVEMGKEIKLPCAVGRQLLRSNVESNPAEEYWRRVVSLPFLDHLINQLEERFKGRSKQALKAHF